MSAPSSASVSSSRLNLRVGPSHYLPVALKTRDDVTGPWLDELMALLHAEVPQRLPHALERGSAVAGPSAAVRADSIQATLTFVPRDSSCSLFCPDDDRGLSAVSTTLLVAVEPLPEAAVGGAGGGGRIGACLAAGAACVRQT